MSRFGTVAQQYFDASGKPLAGGKLYFYEPGTTTAKTVYSDEDLITSIAQPVTLDASGYQPDIFFAGQAKVKLDDSEDTQIDVVDPVGDQPVEQFPIWSSGTSYSEGALIQGSDNVLYVSLGDSNSGNDPTSTSGFWLAAGPILAYDSGFTYNSGMFVYSGSSIWACVSDATIGVTPSTGASEWELTALPIAGGTLTGGLTITGALAGVTTLSMGGAITGVTSITASGALSGVTTLSMGGALTGATSVTMNGDLTGIDDLSLSGSVTGGIFTVSDGASVTLNPANGTRQIWVLGASRTASVSISSGQGFLLYVDDGAGNSLSLPFIDEWIGGEPTLNSSGYTAIWIEDIGSHVIGMARV